MGELANGFSRYRVRKGDNGEVTIYPYAEIPFTDKWIFENKETLDKVKKQFGDLTKND